MAEDYLILDPPRELVFRGPFTEDNVRLLFLTNTSSMCVGFKMRCTAAQYYASNPAVGVIAPRGSTMISVSLSELGIKDFSELDSCKKHRFGITYLPVAEDCTAADVDKVLKASSKNKIAYLQSVILTEGEEYVRASSPVQSVRERIQSFDTMNNDKLVPPKPSAKPPLKRVPSDREFQYLQELQLKESVITELQKEKDELAKKFNLEKQQLVVEMKETLQKETEEIKRKEQELREKQLVAMELVAEMKETLRKETEEIKRQEQELRVNLEKQLAAMKLENEKLKDEQFENIDISFWEVTYKDFELNENIGFGAWGYVAKGVYKEQQVAVKCVHKNIVSMHTIQLLRREVAMMAKIRHPCLLLFIAVSFDHPSGSPMIITELMECSLRDGYRKKGMLSGRSKIRIMIDVACALHYLHTHKERILHRDVSSANVLIHQTIADMYHGKLSDFGSANFARQAVTAGPGAEIYMAPEVPRDSRQVTSVAKQTTKIDVYSYGVLLCEVFASEPQLPFAKVMASMRESIRSQFPFMYEQIMNCTSLNPEDRPEIKDVLCGMKTRFSKK